MGCVRRRVSKSAVLLAALTVALGLGSSPVHAADLRLTWRDNSGNESGFQIERRAASGGTYAPVASVGANVTAWTDTGLTTGTTYCYRVRANGTAGSSGYTNEACAAPVVLSVAKTGTGAGTVTGPGINCGTDCTAPMASGATVTLSAAASSGSTFAGWSGGGCSGTGTCTVTPSASVTVAASFTAASAPPPTSYTLTVARSGTGTGTVTGPGITCGTDCTATVGAGTAVTLSAAPASDSTFSGWSGGACTGTGSCTVTVSAATTVTASFALRTYTLTVARSGTGAGTVTGPGITCGTDCTTTVGSGTSVTLAASAATGSTFSGWSGGGCAGTGTCTVSVLAATTVTAGFTLADSVATRIVTGGGPGGPPRVRGFSASGEATAADFDAFAPGFQGGVFVATGSLTGLGPAIVAGAGPGTGGEVRVHRPDGTPAGIGFFPHGSSFTGGVRVAVCDSGVPGRAAIVTASGPGPRAAVAVWDVNGTTVTRRFSFCVGPRKFAGGAFVACGDTTGDGLDEVVVGLDGGGRPQVAVYSISGSRVKRLVQFDAYAASFTGGVRVAAADLDGDGRTEVVTAPGPGASPVVVVFAVTGSSVTELGDFDAYDPGFQGGVFVAGGLRDGAGRDRVVVSPGGGEDPYVRVFALSGSSMLDEATFLGADPGSPGGITVGVAP
jgi:hypothetical protein